jgi:dienelactone hydrolase
LNLFSQGLIMNLFDSRLVAVLTVWIGLSSAARAQPVFEKPARYEPSAEELMPIVGQASNLAMSVASRPPGTSADSGAAVDVYYHAAMHVWKWREFFDKKDVATTLKMLDRGGERARALAKGKRPWLDAAGPVALGYVSKVDGSVQPYAVIVPEAVARDRDRTHRVRLDVVLHGRNQTLSAVRFLAAHDGDGKTAPTEGPLTLHVFGRGNNAYRWAGETDVFEAIEAVKRNFPVDDQRIVLRGFSMGGAGAWHLGLHHPSLWSSVEAGAGFTESKLYAKLKDLPPYQEKALHIYDSVDYALNAFDVPIAGYGGEDDPQLAASTHIVDALKSLGFSLKTEGLLTRGEGIDFLRVVGAKMGHKVDPASAKVLSAFHDEHAVKGVNLNPRHIRFVTYTLKYGKAAWLSVEQLNAHYRRAEVDAEIEGSRVVVRKAENVAVLAVDRHAGETIVLGGQEFALEAAVKGLLPNVYFRVNGEGGWRQLDYNESRAFEENVDRGKRRGLQGPIDDAFTGSFLCVRGTDAPWGQAAGRWTSARLDQFVETWALGMRGNVRVKDDTEVTAADIENHHLILFGDPGSNRLIALVLHDLPLTWTRSEVTLAGATYTAADHVPVLIAPNPLNPHRYVVLNSGHTFGAKDFAGTNALLYPRLGDHAVFQTDGRNATLKASGFFDEGWSSRGR